jgi:transposase
MMQSPGLAKMTCTRHTFTDEQGERTYDPFAAVLQESSCRAHRAFFNALLWMAPTGAAWRDLPERLGKCNLPWRRNATKPISDLDYVYIVGIMKWLH